MVTFNATNYDDDDTYSNFIGQFRASFDAQTVRNIPRLQAVDGFADVICQVYGEYKLRIRFNKRNLYLIGFQSMRQVGAPWYEVRGGSDIPGSNELPFSCSYIHLAKQSNLPFKKINVCRQSIVNGIIKLSEYPADGCSGTICAKAFRALVVFFAEAARFRSVTIFTSSAFLSQIQEDSVIGDNDWIDPLVHSWGDLSRVYVGPPAEIPGILEGWQLRNGTGQNIATVEDLEAEVAILNS